MSIQIPRLLLQPRPEALRHARRLAKAAVLGDPERLFSEDLVPVPAGRLLDCGFCGGDIPLRDVFIGVIRAQEAYAKKLPAGTRRATYDELPVEAALRELWSLLGAVSRVPAWNSSTLLRRVELELGAYPKAIGQDPPVLRPEGAERFRRDLAISIGSLGAPEARFWGFPIDPPFDALKTAFQTSPAITIKTALDVGDTPAAVAAFESLMEWQLDDMERREKIRRPSGTNLRSLHIALKLFSEAGEAEQAVVPVVLRYQSHPLLQWSGPPDPTNHFTFWLDHIGDPLCHPWFGL